MFWIAYTKRAAKDMELLRRNCLEDKALNLIETLKTNPFQDPPPYEKLLGNLKGAYSRRINRQHRLVYEVFDEQIFKNGIVYDGYIKVIRMWSHYDM